MEILNSLRIIIMYIRVYVCAYSTHVHICYLETCVTSIHASNHRINENSLQESTLVSTSHMLLSRDVEITASTLQTCASR